MRSFRLFRQPLAASLALLLLVSLSLSSFSIAAAEDDDLELFITGRGIYSFRVVPVYALTTANELLIFDQRSPERIRGRVSLSGLEANENLVDIDFRPATGELYGVGSSSQLYIIDTLSGAAKPIGGKFSTPLSGARFAIDFNPTVDRIRLVSGSGQNLRINPLNGAVAATDGTLAYAGADKNAGKSPKIVGAAYTNSYAGSTKTALYNLDADFNTLTTQNPPNDGTQNTTGDLGLDAGEIAGFDIRSFSDTGVAALQSGSAGSSALYTIDLKTGKADYVGQIGGGVLVRGLATPVEQRVFALTTANELLSFDRYQPRDILARVKVTGLEANENLLAVDFRPLDGLLYGIGSSSQLYQINLDTGAVKAIGSKFSPALDGKYFSMDFNPTVDRIRLVSDSGQNLRLHPETGAVAATDNKLNYAEADKNAGKSPKIVASAYTNSYAGAGNTTLYNIDPALGVLTSQNPPNNGTLNTVNRLTMAATDLVGFDIASYAPRGLVSLQTMSGASGLYTLNLTTGDLIYQDLIGTGETVRDLALPIGSRDY